MRSYRKHSAPGLLSRVVNRPLIASVDLARFYFAYLAERKGLEIAVVDGAEGVSTKDIAAVGKYSYREGSGIAPMVPGTGIAVIEVTGSLTHKLGEIDPYSGMTGYDGIQAKLEAALADPACKGILLDINSGGGEVHGGFDLADKLAAAGKIKPMWAVADEQAFSGAYLIASQAARIIAPRTGEVGSVGVIAMHFDYSRAMKNEGVEATVIKSGAQKDAYSSLKPLAPEVLAKLQAECDGVYAMFVSAVASGRRMDANAIRATEAAIYAASEALQLGLIDAIQTTDDAFAEFAAKLAQPATSIFLPAAPSPAAPKAGVTSTNKEIQMDPNAAAAAAASLASAAGAAAAVDPTLAERNRVIGIQTMARPEEQQLAADLVANGSSLEVAGLAFAKSRSDVRAADAAVRRAEAPRPLPIAPNAGAAAVVDPALPLDQRCKLEWERSAALQAEFGGSYADYHAYMKAEATGRLKGVGSAKFGKGQPLPGAAAA